MAKKVYIIIILIICLIPSVFMLVLGPSSAGANEILSRSPKFGIDMLSEASDYFDDHFAFRKELISCYSWINAKIFKTSSNDQIILGNDGYLYYADTSDDYMGIHLDDAQLKTIAENIKKLQNEAENNGSEFIFTIAPNKSSLHGENMPQYIKCGHASSNAVLLEKYLEEYGVNYVNLFDDSIPYYKTDSHWTSQGAAMACDALLGTDYSKGSFHETDEIYLGDLYEMLYPSFKGVENLVVYDGALNYECEKDPNGGKAITINTTGGGEKSLFCYRDSFGISLYPYLADAASSATFSRSTQYDMSLTADADIVIIEIVERNLKNLL